jgi:8-oxo-dGTP diphosphatase
MSPHFEQNIIQQLSIDCVIFGYKNQELKVLVPQMKLNQLYCTLPGGFIMQNESIDESARRILQERTGLKDIYLEQYRVFGHTNRVNTELVENLKNTKNDFKKMLMFADNNFDWLSKRFISIGYYALVNIDKVNPQKTDFDESIGWYNVKNLPNMIIDHNEMVSFALETLRQNLDSKLIGFNLLPDTFTMKEVQELYEAVYDKPFARNNFQKKILDMNVLERLEKKFTGAANKAPYLYRFLR